MQASKIKIEFTYALKLDIGPAGRLVRLKVREIHSKRRDNSPSGITSTVYGFVDDSRELTGPYSTDMVLGEFAEYQELVAAKAAQDKAERDRRQEIENLRAEVVALLAHACPGVNDLKGKIEAGHAGVNIRDAALPAIVNFLKTRAA